MKIQELQKRNTEILKHNSIHKMENKSLIKNRDFQKSDRSDFSDQLDISAEARAMFSQAENSVKEIDNDKIDNDKIDNLKKKVESGFYLNENILAEAAGNILDSEFNHLI